jgi:hypothetical protein
MKFLASNKTERADKKRTSETATRVMAIYAVVLGYNSATASFIGADPKETELLIGKGCVMLTRKFAKYGTSAHVLPGLETPDDEGSAEPLYMVVGPMVSVRKALDALTPGDSHLYYNDIIKLPV